MTLDGWAALASLVASGIALLSILVGVFRAGKMFGALSQQFTDVQSDIAELKMHRDETAKTLQKIVSRCKMCLEEDSA